MNEQRDHPRTPSAPKQKKPYQVPCLASYGSVEKLTQGQVGSMADGASGMGMA